MTFAALLDFAVLILLETARAQCHGVIQLHARADVTRLAHDDARPVIDKKMRTDFCAGMNVNSGPRMRPFGHEARNQRHFPFIKKMRHALNRDRFYRRISHDHFLVTGRGRISFVGGVDVSPEDLSQRPQLQHEPVQNLVRFFLRGIAHGILPETLGDLRLHPHMQALDPAPRHSRQIA